MKDLLLLVVILNIKETNMKIPIFQFNALQFNNFKVQKNGFRRNMCVRER